MAEKERSRPRRPGRRTARDRRLALTITASALAASALAGCEASPSRGVAGHAPDCAPAVSSPREGSWDDPNGCWERRPGGQPAYRTVWGGRPYYSSSPPYYSRYYASESAGRGWRGLSSTHSSSSGGYHGAPSGAG